MLEHSTRITLSHVVLHAHSNTDSHTHTNVRQCSVVGAQHTHHVLTGRPARTQQHRYTHTNVSQCSVVGAQHTHHALTGRPAHTRRTSEAVLNCQVSVAPLTESSEVISSAHDNKIKYVRDSGVIDLLRRATRVGQNRTHALHMHCT